MTTTLFFTDLLNGIAIGSVYAIFALGYTLVFSILRVINFAHAAIFTLGAYFTYVLIGSKFGYNGILASGQGPFSLPFPLAMFIGGLLAGLCAIAVERVAFRPLRAKGADPLLSLVSSLGVAIAIVNVIQYLVGAEAYSYPSNAFGTLPPAVVLGLLQGARIRTGAFGTLPTFVVYQVSPGVRIRTDQVIIFAVSIVVMLALTYLINRTKLGKALQAVSEDTTTASLLGINVNRLILYTFFLSGFLGGIAGTLLAKTYSISNPYFGINYGLKGLAVMVLGGLGDVPGTIVGGFALGLAEAFVPPDYIGYKDAVAFALLFIVLLLRPEGILGRANVQKV